MACTVNVLYDGYSKTTGSSEMIANCTCTLVKGAVNIIVDTMTPWDKELLIKGLARHQVECKDIAFVVCTHGHSDHVGNNNLFLNAKHIVGHSVSFKDTYFFHDFEVGTPYIINEFVEVVATRGHTLTDVSVIVKTQDLGIVAITGDLFEREEDIADPTLWKETAGSEDPKKQQENRNKILLLADWIVPGHGPLFQVTSEMRRNALTSH